MYVYRKWIESIMCYIVVQGSPVKIMATTPGKAAGNGTEIRQDIVRFYKDSGLEPVAKEVLCDNSVCGGKSH